jgi:hypothetical protein
MKICNKFTAPTTVIRELGTTQAGKSAKVTAADTQGVLPGLRSCEVLVESIDEGGKAIGLRLSQISTAVELTLRRNGLRVASRAESMKLPGSPTVYVRVSVLDLCFRFDFQLRETVQLHRKSTLAVTLATTWSSGYLGTHGGNPNYIIDAIKETADIFCLDYLKANPR